LPNQIKIERINHPRLIWKNNNNNMKEEFSYTMMMTTNLFSKHLKIWTNQKTKLSRSAGSFFLSYYSFSSKETNRM